MSARRRVGAAIVGGGMFGAWIALSLERRGIKTLVLERGDELLGRASYNNQARVHNGYHYPRSILTGIRSRMNAGRFLAEFADCVDTDFRKYYAISAVRSNVTAAQFEAFCDRIGARWERTDDEVARLFDPERVEAVYRTEEWAFDARKLRERMLGELTRAGVEVLVGHEARAVRAAAPGADGARLEVEAIRRADDAALVVEADFAFNCTYSGLNDLMRRSSLPLVPLKQELAEIALVEVPDELRHVGVTVMCGPFFSCMPFPDRGLHSFSHVRYTPNHSWHDLETKIDNQAYMDRVRPTSRFSWMQADARHSLPIVDRFDYVDSLWELKTVLPASEYNDSRPILFQRDAGLPGLICVLGGKIDNVYDVERELDALQQTTSWQDSRTPSSR
ncbi:MAG: FAD-dependent oxidoreductase [Planctomycetota bacterium]